MSLHEIKSEPNQETIAYLDNLLSMAKSGELQGLAVILKYDDGSTGGGWCNISSEIMGVIGELEILKRDLIDINVQLRVDPETGHTDY